ncbi:protein ecdysoneless homolog [Tyto alba]|uniref:protein ecdysoneless homolog n=1 Tax=Tyto alba TaxID=56313 RepID=UPI001C674861|nr:protein ecdysoneless homolog [Tyto alba]
MEGSAKYLELLHRAEDYFQQSVTKPESSFEVSPGDEILTVLQRTTVDLKEFEREAACVPPEDDDSWLEITAGDLDQMLKEARNESLPSSNGEEQKYDLEAVAERADSEELDSDDLDEEEEFDFSSEGDEDLDVEDQRQDQKVPPNELIGSLKSYMSEMDSELAHNNVGKSFTIQKKGVSMPRVLVCSIKC